MSFGNIVPGYPNMPPAYERGNIAMNAFYRSIGTGWPSMGPGLPTPSFNFSATPVDVEFGEPPSPNLPTYHPPTFDAELNLQDITIPETVALPDAPAPFDASDLFKVDKPTFDIDDTHLRDLPTLATPDLPGAPNVVTHQYQPPATADLEVPDVVTPAFVAQFEGKEPDALGDVSARFKQEMADATPQMRAHLETAVSEFLNRMCPQYQSALQTLESKLAAALAGNTAIDDAIEQQIFQRAKARVESERFANERQATQALSRRGFSIPPGTLQAAIREANAVATRAVSAAASETAIQRAQLELNHLQFCLNLTATVRQAVMQAAVQVQSNAISLLQVSMEVGRQVANFAMEAFNAELRLFEAKLALYRARAEVYRTELEASFAQLEVFKAKLEAERLKTDIDRNAIELYQAKIAGEESKVRLYVAQLEGVRQVVEIERNKLDIFRAQVDAFSARVRGKEAEFGAYKASMDGDQAKVGVFSEQIRAYQAQIQAANSIMEGRRIQSDVTTQHNRSMTEYFGARVREYEARLRANGQVFDTARDAYVAALDAWRADLSAKAEAARTHLQMNELSLRAGVSDAEIKTRVILGEAGLMQNINSVAAQVGVSNTSAMGSMASAALSAISDINVTNN